MSAAKLNFLVAEDHEFQRKVLTRILGGLGVHAVYQATDGMGAGISGRHCR
jgi:CheY-like chemotaxis protein